MRRVRRYPHLCAAHVYVARLLLESPAARLITGDPSESVSLSTRRRAHLALGLPLDKPVLRSSAALGEGMAAPASLSPIVHCQPAVPRLIIVVMPLATPLLPSHLSSLATPIVASRDLP